MEPISRLAQAGLTADNLIAGEVYRQDKMWGVANERADVSNGELLQASVGQSLALLRQRVSGQFPAAALIYPENWSGFRNYGSEVANLVVAAAFLRQEIKRLVAAGADTTRTPRDPQTQPYTGDQPAIQL